MFSNVRTESTLHTACFSVVLGCQHLRSYWLLKSILSRNSNGAKKFYINLEDEVSFVMSKELAWPAGVQGQV